MIYSEITEKVLAAAFEVMNELGPGFLESVYEKALAILLREQGFSVEEQKPLDVFFRGECVGKFYADIVVDDKIVVELKAVKTLLPEHNAQTIHYLKASDKELGLLINFGHSRIPYRRLYPQGVPRQK